ncbi:hypothetical protein [Marinobacter sp.]|uniref:hypothetical protein n=1 Tax=Marinobacter sp. TaxID=50741 RepID=UPI00356B2F10
MNRPESCVHWWLGLADLLGHGVQHGAIKVKRIHLSVADEAFRVLTAVPVTRPTSRVVQACHHGISHLSYNCVSFAGQAVVEFAGAARSGTRI